MVVIRRRLQKKPVVGWLPGVFCALLLGIIALHGLSLHGAGGATEHGLHVAAIQPADGHSTSHAATTVDLTGAVEAPAPAPESDVVAVCAGMLAGAGLAWLLLILRRRADSWLTSGRGWLMPFGFPARVRIGPPDLRFSILRC